MIGRRGPFEASFTNPELREIIQTNAWDTYIEPPSIDLNHPADVKERSVLRKFDLLASANRRGQPIDASRKRLIFHFLRSPEEIFSHSGMSFDIHDLNIT